MTPNRVLLRQYPIAELLQADGGLLSVRSDADAYRICRRLAFGHYENFPVMGVALGSMRNDIAAIYAFARLADDVADELAAPSAQKLALLDQLGQWLTAPPPRHPIFRALARTMQRRALPRELFERLLVAFRFDAAYQPFERESDLVAYCHNSAAPIGEALLRLAGQWNAAVAPASDAVCAGLQVLNFWQDLGLDLQRGRCTIPLEWLPEWQLPTLELLRANRSVMESVTARFAHMVDTLLGAGTTLLARVTGMRLRLQIRATLVAARHVAHMCRQRGIEWHRRPRLRWWHIPAIAARTLVAL